MFSGHFFPIDRYPPFSACLKPILFGEFRKLRSAVNGKYFGIICQRYLVLMLASQLAWFHTRPVSVSNDRYPKSSGPRVMLLLSGLLLREDLIVRIVMKKHTQLLHQPNPRSAHRVGHSIVTVSSS